MTGRRASGGNVEEATRKRRHRTLGIDGRCHNVRVSRGMIDRRLDETGRAESRMRTSNTQEPKDFARWTPRKIPRNNAALDGDAGKQKKSTKGGPAAERCVCRACWTLEVSTPVVVVVVVVVGGKKRDKDKVDAHLSWVCPLQLHQSGWSPPADRAIDGPGPALAQGWGLLRFGGRGGQGASEGPTGGSSTGVHSHCGWPMTGLQHTWLREWATGASITSAIAPHHSSPYQAPRASGTMLSRPNRHSGDVEANGSGKVFLEEII